MTKITLEGLHLPSVRKNWTSLTSEQKKYETYTLCDCFPNYQADYLTCTNED